jgi:membrane-associated phospholipid phosphatase
MRCLFIKAAAAGLALAASTFGRPCSAQTPQASLWKDSWPQFSTTEAVLTLSAGVGTVALALVPPAENPRWRGGILFDEGARDAMRVDDAEGRRSFRSIGDMSYYAAPLLPLLVDSFVVSLLVRSDKRAAANLALISVEAFSYTGLITFSALRGVARERPDSSECRRSSSDPTGCRTDTESFYSGHTAVSATSAGLVCANHTRMPLWGHPVADASACVVAISGALLTGTTRIIADRHYATDVTLGLGIGFGIGYAVPVLLHYSRAKESGLTLVPDPSCDGTCVALRGSF